MIKNIRHVGIAVNDLLDGVSFYEKLGFQLFQTGLVTKEEAWDLYGTNEAIPYTKMLIFVKGYTIEHSEMIELYQVKGESGFQSYNHIAFTVDNIEEAFKFFGDKGLLMSRKIVERSFHKLFFAIDPWLNMLELVQKI